MELSLIKRAPVEVSEFSFTPIMDAYEEMMDAAEEVGGTVTFRAKMPAGGTKMFEIDDGTGEPQYTDKLTGVVIFSHRCNARFLSGAGTGEPPVCSSMDGKEGVAFGGSVIECGGCPYNEFGTDANGRGKACKNMIRLYMMAEGSPIPVVLSLPPTSVRAWQNYRIGVLAARGLRPEKVVTELTLSVCTSKGGDKYSAVVPKLVGCLSPEAEEMARQFAGALRPMTEVTADDYRTVGTEAKEGNHETD